MPRSFDSVFYGAAGGVEDLPSDDEFNRVSFLSHFEGANNGVNNAFDDGSANNHTITAAGNVTQGSFGPFARPDGEFAVHFDGGGAYNCAADADFAFGTGDFCMEAWAFVEADDYAYSRVFCFGPTYGTGDSHGITVDHTDHSHKIRYYDSGSSFFLYSSAAAPRNTWFHVAVTKASNTVRLFINGTAEDSGTNTNAPEDSSTNTVAIGNDPNAGGGGEDFQGFISNARVVKGSAVYTSDFTPSTAPLTAITNTKLLTCQSNRFVDNSAEAHAITIGGTAGTVQVSAFGPFLTSAVYKPAVNGASAYFDGNGDYLSASTPFGAQNIWTIETWYYPLSYSGSGGLHARIWTEGTSLSASITLITNQSAKKIMLYYDDSERLTSSSVIPLNSWTHIAVVSDGSSLKLYVNGVLNDTYASNLPTENRDFLVASMSSSTGASNSYVSCLRATSTAVYTGNFTLPTAPPTAITGTMLLLNMADGQAIDSAAQNNLTLFNDAKTSTTRAKFGGTSLYLDGSDYATIENSSSRAFGTGDFTVELFIWLNGSPDQFDYIFDMRSSSDLSYTWALSFNYMGNTSDKLQWATNNTSSSLVLSADYPSLNQWVHIAVCRSGTTSRMFYDGTQVAIKTSDTFDYKDTGYQGYIGCRHSVESYINAYMDEIRFSKTARYTSNFTAPTAAFPDKGQDA